MFSLGHKKQNAKSLGHKNYHFNNLGHKIHDKGQNQTNLNLKLTSSSDGIDNYSNSVFSMYEPIKGVEIKSNKSNKFNVEKPKRKVHNFTPQNYV